MNYLKKKKKKGGGWRRLIERDLLSPPPIPPPHFSKAIVSAARAQISSASRRPSSLEKAQQWLRAGWRALRPRRRRRRSAAGGERCPCSSSSYCPCSYLSSSSSTIPVSCFGMLGAGSLDLYAHCFVGTDLLFVENFRVAYVLELFVVGWFVYGLRAMWEIL